MFFSYSRALTVHICLFQLAAVFDEDHRGGMESPRESISNGFSSDGASPEAMHYCPHLEYEDSSRGEIEVNEAILKTRRVLEPENVAVPVK
ncbi:hypothetical protein ATANTOWER_026247 [Ataeniobius toweri]|uniref:Uncharacterized protein n=1 Tax=Ataeniobius toweri TaxID=208326 RepID=A0ABU7CAI1_9TELE|nr:hypothetical protein [Ataeniobius toweri]